MNQDGVGEELMCTNTCLDFSLEEMIQGHVPVFCVGSIEVERVTREIIRLGEDRGLMVNIYSPGEGLKRQGEKVTPMDPVGVLDQIIDAHIRNSEQRRRTLWILQLFHLFLKDPDPLVLSKLRMLHDKATHNVAVALLVEPHFHLPEELKDLLLVNYPLPDHMCLQGLVDSDVEEYASHVKQEVVCALSGFTYREAENILSLSIVRGNRIEPLLIRSFKEQVVKNKGDSVLEFLRPDMSLEDVGGMESLTAWLRTREVAFLNPQRLIDHRLPPPRGLLLLGVPGCGKTLVAKAVSGSWGIPLLKLNAAALYASEVGASEKRLFRALDIARAMAPCVLLIDEIEKGFAPVSSFSDGGIALRILASLLDFLQECHDRIFIVATSNALNELNPELLRRGRWDEIFFVDLPTSEERHHILEIMFTRYRVDVQVDPECVRATEGFSGVEIEQAIRDTLYAECIYGNKPFNAMALIRQIKNLIPLSTLRQSEIEALRRWASIKARPANGTQGIRRTASENMAHQIRQ